MRCVERTVYSFCSFVVIFACLGTFASYFLSSSMNETHARAKKVVKIACPLVMIGGFIIMVLIRCCFQEKPRSPANAEARDRCCRRAQVDLLPPSLGPYWQELDFCSLPTYFESVNSPQYSIDQGEPPPKYEDVIGVSLVNGGFENQDARDTSPSSIELSGPSRRIIDVVPQFQHAQVGGNSNDNNNNNSSNNSNGNGNDNSIDNSNNNNYISNSNNSNNTNSRRNLNCNDDDNGSHNADSVERK